MNEGYPVSPPYSRAALLAKLTGAATLAAGALLYGNATSQLQTLALGTAGRVLVAGASAPAWSDSGLSYASGVLTVAGSVPGTPSSGQVMIGGGQVKAGGVVSCQGLQNTVGDFTSRPDEDAQTILGRIRCGFFTGLGDNASFAHYDQATSSSYALRQDASGATVLNSATGQNLRLSINNTAVLTLTASAVTASQPITVDKTFTDTSGTLGSLNSTVRANPGSASTSQLYAMSFGALSTAGNAQNLTGSTYALCGIQGFGYHFGSGTANKVFGGYLGAQQRSGAGAVGQLSALVLQVDNLDASTAVTGGYGINILAPVNSGGNFTSWRAISIAATAVGTTNCIGIDIGAMTGTGAYAIRTSTGPVLFGDAVTIINGTAASPGIKTSENHGLFRNSSTSMGMAVAGALAAALYGGDGSTYGTSMLLAVPSAGSYSLIYNQRADAQLYVSGSSGSSSGGQLRVYGSTHATKADRVEFTRGSTISAYFDGSGNLICNGTVTVPNGTAASPGIRTSENHGLFRNSSTSMGMAVAGVAMMYAYAPTGGYGGIFQFNQPVSGDVTQFYNVLNDGSMNIRGGTFSAGGTIKLYGGTHASANYVEFCRGNTVSAYFDNSGKLTINGTTDGILTVGGKIAAKVAVPGSFADLAAVQSYLASILT